MSALLLLACTGSAPALAAEQQLVLLSSGARCLDGSPAGYYVDSLNSSRWIVWLEGGGICQSEKDCKIRSEGPLGSSKKWPATKTASRGLLQSDATLNPDFHTYNHIFVPYCSGDVWTGQLTKAINPFADDQHDAGGWTGGYFMGHTILASVLANATAGRQVDELLLTGCSAGGIGTIGNCDFAATTFPNAQVRCRPEAGWFGLGIKTYAAFSSGAAVSWEQLHHFEASAWTLQIKPHHAEAPEYARCLQSFVPVETCPNATLCCSLPPFLYQHIRTPMFVSENTADSYQVFTQGKCPGFGKKQDAYILYLHGVLSGSLTNTVMRGPKRSQDGLFAPACLQHCMKDWNGINKATRVQGISHQQAFGDWYFGRNSTSHHMLINNSTSASQFKACGF